MIEYKEWQLSNGLKVVLNEDTNTPLVVVNLLYNVGAKNENPELTGIAHLFEHLMFSGSKNAPDYDELIQKAGGENNAFTSNDITNYYITLPKENIELALWLESDRMNGLNLDQKSLDVQKKVVIEEFKQRYFNQPYGDVWLHLRPLCYKKHPYMWPTIGKSIAQIESTTLDDANAFYQQFYSPNNCTLSIAGNISFEDCKTLVAKHFGSLPKAEIKKIEYEFELPQAEKRFTSIEADVPFDALYMAFPVEGKNDKSFQVADLLTDVLSGGSSSRFYYSLVKEQQLFGDISAYLTGEDDPGLLVITGKISPGVSFEQAESAVWNEINLLVSKGLNENELLKIINKKITAEVYSEMQILSKAMKLAFFHGSGKLSEVNEVISTLQAVTEQEIIEYAKSHLTENKCNLLSYKKI
ncbi:MAG: zinc protease [Saprospiraceae bacterium]|jgi:zinc protease